ncbi:MAG: hypothetical protein WD049_10400 [Candidatus Paceibacterota bacterium]
MKLSFSLTVLAFVFSVSLIATAVFLGGARTAGHAQDIPFGGRFTTITDVCCDGTIVLQHEAVRTGFPSGRFKTSWGMDAYRELFYFPLPQTCALGFVKPFGSCVTVSSLCESSTPTDFTITTIGTSLPSCQFASYSGTVPSGTDSFGSDTPDSDGGSFKDRDINDWPRFDGLGEEPDSDANVLNQDRGSFAESSRRITDVSFQCRTARSSSLNDSVWQTVATMQDIHPNDASRQGRLGTVDDDVTYRWSYTGPFASGVSQLLKSTNGGSTFSPTGVSFASSGIHPRSFIHFDWYQVSRREGYLYSIAESGNPSVGNRSVYLMRVPYGQEENRGAYQILASTGSDDVWTNTLSQGTPLFTDTQWINENALPVEEIIAANASSIQNNRLVLEGGRVVIDNIEYEPQMGVIDGDASVNRPLNRGRSVVTFLPRIGRFIMIVPPVFENKSDIYEQYYWSEPDTWTVLEAEEPWGPWSVVDEFRRGGVCGNFGSDDDMLYRYPIPHVIGDPDSDSVDIWTALGFENNFRLIRTKLKLGN